MNKRQAPYLVALCLLVSSMALGAEVRELWIVNPSHSGRGIDFIPASAAGNTNGVDELVVLTGTGNPATVEVRAASNGAVLGSFPMPGTPDATLPQYRIAASDDGVIFTNGFEGSVTAVLDDLGTTPTLVINQSTTGSQVRGFDVCGSVAAGTCTLFLGKNLTVQVWRQTGTDANGLPTFGVAADDIITIAGLDSAQGISGLDAIDDSEFIVCDNSAGDGVQLYRWNGSTYVFVTQFGQYTGFARQEIAWDGNNTYVMAEAGGGEDGYGIAAINPNLNILPQAGLDNDLDAIYDAGATVLNHPSAVVSVCMDHRSGVAYGYSGGTAPNTGIFGIVAIDDVSTIVINEFAYDDFGTDNREYIELHNTALGSFNIGGYMVKTGDLNVDNTFTIPAGTLINGKGHYVIGTAIVENVDQVIAANIVQNGEDWIQLADPTGQQLDYVQYETNKATAGIPFPPDGVTTITLEGLGYWGNHTMSDDPFVVTPADVAANNYASLSIARHADGQDTDDNAADFGSQIATPGKANNSYGTIDVSALPITFAFDDADGTDAGNVLTGSYQSGIVQDPTVADTIGSYDFQNNPTAIPASPQGGNILVAWDDTGGGDALIYNLNAPIQDVELEAYVYVQSGIPGGTDGSWKTFFCARGMEDGHFYNLGTANGAYGVLARHIYDAIDGNKIQVAERKAGVETLIGEIPIQAGVNDGWQRLLLSVDGPDVVAILGGVYGSYHSGEIVYGSTSIVQAGGIGAGFREYFATNSASEPIRMDNLTIRQPAATSVYNLVSGPKISVYDQATTVLGLDVSAVDILNGKTGTVLAGGFHPATVGNVSNLTNGVWDTNGLTVIAQDGQAPNPSLQVEYSLSKAQIDDVIVFAGHDGDGSRAWINCDVEIDVGAGYVPLATLRTGPYGQAMPSQTMVSYVQTQQVGAGPLAVSVDKIRFTFYDVSHNSTGFFQANDDNTTNPPLNYPNQGTILKEIDVLGAEAPVRVDDWTLF